MKNMKKILALVVAVLMIAASMSVAFAADTGSITLKSSPTVDVTGKTFSAYKILNATFRGEAVSYTVPSELKSWYNTYFTADGKDVETQATAANKTFDQVVAEKINALTTAAALRTFLDAALAAAKTNNLTAYNSAVVDGKVRIANLPAGYYAVEETTANVENKYKSAVLLNTVKDADVEMTIKANVPTPDKKIVTADQLYNEKANEVGIGRTVNYVVTEQVPNWFGYDHYYYIMKDTMSKGLTFNNDIVVKIGEATLQKDTDYYVYKETKQNGDTYFEIAFNNIKSYDIGTAITVTYSAQVNKDAVTGINPNTNKIEIDYSNNPNKSERHDGDQPGKPASTTDHPIGTGPASWTDTYTTKITILKRDASNNNTPLPGVEFTLTGTSKSVVVKGKDKFVVDPAGGYWMLNDGTYTTTAPRTEATLEETTGDSGWVEDDNTTDPEARTIGDHKYRPYKSDDGNTTHYIIHEANTSDYKSTTIKYSKTVADETEVHNYTVKMVGTTDAYGNLVFEKLGAGNYTISETGVLPGYNAIPDITFTIECEVPNAQSVKDGTEKATWSVKNVNNGAFTTTDTGFEITIDNNKGVELPSTGGMGTTILYIGGSILVILAAVLLITKRRMSSEE